MNLSRLDFEAAGFARQPEVEPGVEIWVKTFEAAAAPYIRDHLVGTENITETTEAEVIIRGSAAGWTIQLTLPEVDYVEEPLPLNDDEGLGVFKDAQAAHTRRTVVQPSRPRPR